VHQIPCAGSVFGVYLSTIGQARNFKLLHFRTEQVQLLNEFLQLRMIRVLHDPFVPVATPLSPRNWKETAVAGWMLSILRHSRYRMVNVRLNTSRSSGAGESWVPWGSPPGGQVSDIFATQTKPSILPGYATSITAASDVHHSPRRWDLLTM
jgi:hypothetical protein